MHFNQPMLEADTAVVGGGLVGMAIAYGLQRQGARVTVYDEGDDALRAARGNFGLVWIQGKGAQLPEYARWSRRSAALWPEFAAELLEYSGRDVELHQPGGLDYCLSEADAEATVAQTALSVAHAPSTAALERGSIRASRSRGAPLLLLPPVRWTGAELWRASSLNNLNSHGHATAARYGYERIHTHTC